MIIVFKFRNIKLIWLVELYVSIFFILFLYKVVILLKIIEVMLMFVKIFFKKYKVCLWNWNIKNKICIVLIKNINLKININIFIKWNFIVL